MKRLAVLLLPSLLLPSFALACSGGGGGDTDLEARATEAAGIEPQAEVSIAAEDLEYDTDTLVVPAGTQVTVNFDNQDSGTLHNVSVYNDPDATQDIYKGELISGVETVQYQFTAPPAGVYFFKCDAHPDMNGAFIAK